MKVKYTGNEISLTKGNVYEVVEATNNGLYLIRNNFNREWFYEKEDFEIVK